MKKLKYVLFSLFTMMLFIPSVLAATGKVTITGTNQVVVGNKVTVTVTISSGVNIGSWQMNLNYDKNVLQLTSSSAEAGGTMMAASSATGVKNKSYTFTFKTLKTGSTNLSITSALAYAFDDLSKIDLTQGTKKVSIITQAELEASYSKNNNLKSLSVSGYELNPAFNANTLEYSVTVPENTKEISISAQVSDGTASVSGTGTKEVTAGTNTFNIVVKAQNGSEKTYTISVDVKDNNPIEVFVDGKAYTVVKIKEYLPTILSYEDTTVTINEFEIPAYKSEFTGFTLVGLKDTEGNIGLFIYDNDKYIKYNEISIDKLTVYPKETDKELKGFSKEDVTIGDINVTGFVLNKDSNFVTIYGVNVDNGEEGFYTYDKKHNTLIAFNEEVIELMNNYENKISLYSYIIIGFSVILVIMFILLVSKKKKHKKNKKQIYDQEEMESPKEEPQNEIKELESEVDEDFLDIEHKKKKKRK